MNIAVGHQLPRVGFWLVSFLAAPVLNFLINRLTDFDPEPADWLLGLIFGSWVFQPMLFAIWAALGPGRFVIRLPLVVPGLLLVVAAPGVRPGGFRDVERYEFIVMMIATMVIFAATTGLLSVMRWFLKWHIEAHSGETSGGARRLQYDTRYLIILVTLCAIVLGITTNLKFKPPEPPSWLFGPGFFVTVVTIGGALISLLLLPTIAAPLLVLSPRVSRQSIRWALGCWAVLTIVVAAIWLTMNGEIVVIFALMLQLGAVLLGFAAALPLRLAGYRLYTSA